MYSGKARCLVSQTSFRTVAPVWVGLTGPYWGKTRTRVSTPSHPSPSRKSPELPTPDGTSSSSIPTPSRSEDVSPTRHPMLRERSGSTFRAQEGSGQRVTDQVSKTLGSKVLPPLIPLRPTCFSPPPPAYTSLGDVYIGSTVPRSDDGTERNMWSLSLDLKNNTVLPSSLHPTRHRTVHLNQIVRPYPTRPLATDVHVLRQDLDTTDLFTSWGSGVPIGDMSG